MSAGESAREMQPDEKVTAIARVCHEANRAWCEIHGDTSQFAWEEAEAWQRESAIKGVATALAGATPEEQHEAWCTDKRHEGWSHGPVKDPEARTHPCLVAYEKLPPMQRCKDALFGSVVQGLAPALGLAIDKEGSDGGS